MQRRQSTQDVSWFLDIHERKQLNLSPPYQRKSVWTPKDRQYFLDSVFRDYPCPPLYVHKTLDERGSPTYHVIDGKQRLETVILFFEGKVRISEEFGDDRLNKKRWIDISKDGVLRASFLNYSFTVEMFSDFQEDLVNDIFSRLNRNQRGLTRQEIRHAQFNGWFSGVVDAELSKPIWKDFGIVTPGRARRMLDSQFISELIIGVIRKNILGFDQDDIDSCYAEYDDISEFANFLPDDLASQLSRVKSYLIAMNNHNGCIATYARNFAHFYSIWMLVSLEQNVLPQAQQAADRYSEFMAKVNIKHDAMKNKADNESIDSPEVMDYLLNAQSATTDALQRKQRHAALRKVIIGENPS